MQEEERIQSELDQQREAAKELSIILIKRGVNCQLISEGLSTKTVLKLGMTEKVLYIYWRSNPIKLGCQLYFVKSFTRGIILGDAISKEQLDPERCLGINFDGGYKIQLQAKNAATCNALELCLQILLADIKSTADVETQGSTFSTKLINYNYQLTMQQESNLQLSCLTAKKESAFSLCNVIQKMYNNELHRTFQKWVLFVRDANMNNMHNDKHRWRLHSICNMEVDLQAWYHAMFCDEVFRIRGGFWFREAALAHYKSNYDLVNNTLTPMEEAALAHILCSSDTSYGDVAGQMFVVQDIVSSDLFSLFQKLSAVGANVVKFPRSGRPAKKSFRISFVEGVIYLTWSGKYGNQGVDLNTVSSIKNGLSTDVVKKHGNAKQSALYLSLISVGRSVDLCFESDSERKMWEELLSLLMLKETGQIKKLAIEASDDPFEILFLYSAIGKGKI